jgi:beta-lactamase regulating signal transducer with metallopeptidase domain
MGHLDLTAAPLLSALGSAAIKATAILALAALLARLLHRRPAALRHLVWTAGLGSTVAVLVLPVVLPAWHVMPVPSVSVDLGFPDAIEVVPSPQQDAAGRVVERQGGSALPAYSTASHAVTPETPSVQHPAPRSDVPGWPALVLSLWLGGVAAVLARYAWSRLALHRLASSSTVMAGTDVLADPILRSMGIARPVSFRISGDVELPLTWGILRPQVVLPMDASEWAPECRRYVLQHELAHIARHSVAMAFARRSHFEGRLVALLDRTLERGVLSPRRVVMVLSLSVAIVVPFAALQSAGARAVQGAVRRFVDAAPRAAAAPIAAPDTGELRRPVQQGAPDSSWQRLIFLALSEANDAGTLPPSDTAGIRIAEDSVLLLVQEARRISTGSPFLGLVAAEIDQWRGDTRLAVAEYRDAIEHTRSDSRIDDPMAGTVLYEPLGTLALDAAFAERDSTSKKFYLRVASEAAAALSAAHPDDTFVPFPRIGFEILGPGDARLILRPLCRIHGPFCVQEPPAFSPPTPVPAVVREERVLAEWFVNERGSVDSARFTPTPDSAYNIRLDAALRRMQFQAGRTDSTALGTWYAAVLVLDTPDTTWQQSLDSVGFTARKDSVNGFYYQEEAIVCPQCAKVPTTFDARSNFGESPPPMRTASRVIGNRITGPIPADDRVLSDLVRRIPGFSVTQSITSNGVGWGVIRAWRSDSQPDGTCVNFWVDGRAFTESRPRQIDDAVDLQSLRALEAYAPADAPAQFAQRTRSDCATIVVWTNAVIH